MKRSAIAVSISFIAALLPLIGFSASSSSTLVNDVAYRVERELKTIDADLARAARAIEKDVRDPIGKRKALSDLCSGKAYAVDCVFINTGGIMETIEPGKFRKYEFPPKDWRVWFFSIPSLVPERNLRGPSASLSCPRSLYGKLSKT
ncbi:MAG: hypothetical protein H6Q52_3675 [Deltaproteobacteria bacterium]|nr:hypothetical protein [Deltaproteobacteria bacterium]